MNNTTDTPPVHLAHLDLCDICLDGVSEDETLSSVSAERSNGSATCKCGKPATWQANTYGWL